MIDLTASVDTGSKHDIVCLPLNSVWTGRPTTGELSSRCRIERIFSEKKVLKLSATLSLGIEFGQCFLCPLPHNLLEKLNSCFTDVQVVMLLL